MPELEDDDKKGKKEDKKGGKDDKKGKKDKDSKENSKLGKGKGGKEEKGKGKDKAKSPKEMAAAAGSAKESPSIASLPEDKSEKSEKSVTSKKSEKSEKSEGSEGAPAKKGALKPCDKGKKGITKMPPPSDTIIKAMTEEGPVYAERYYNDEYEDDEEQRNYVEVEMFEHKLSNTGVASPRGRGRGRGRGGPVISRGGRSTSPPPLHHESRSIHDEYYYEQCDPTAQHYEQEQLQPQQQLQHHQQQHHPQLQQHQQPMRRSVTRVDTYNDESSGSHHFEGSYYETMDEPTHGGHPAPQRHQSPPRSSSQYERMTYQPEPVVARTSSTALVMSVGQGYPAPMQHHQQARSRSRSPSTAVPPAGPMPGQRSRPPSRQPSRQSTGTPIIVPVTAIIVGMDQMDTEHSSDRRSPRGTRSREYIDP